MEPTTPIYNIFDHNTKYDVALLESYSLDNELYLSDDSPTYTEDSQLLSLYLDMELNSVSVSNSYLEPVSNLYLEPVSNLDPNTNPNLNSPKISKTATKHKRRISKRKAWKPEEDQKLYDLVKKNGPKYWDEIAIKMLPFNRDRNQCRSRYNQYIKKNSNGKSYVQLIGENDSRKFGDWNSDEDDKLRRLVNENGSENWKKIALLLNSKKNSIKCYNRYKYLYPDADVKYFRKWDNDEDAQLLNLVQEFGPYDWEFISSKMTSGRDKAQCCNRYNGN
ncbi:hypothetical protein DICPUDRAFT_154597 [Dictyostelium purpureum]|uniref:Myb-like DNA-binding domain containing protein n=1 Tax=Dictyostelium purpureum TaxID=5786 RepID=F0ZRR4_DICPU|nr:uncharacterized protein DICPUDRAFT_154597 [Dictyostelium purpureum]EGC33353.1 hypothetical protein DICPUDRAFT_154597 [Dictyostelium purpureum]|eukprot:XP_003290104.1 hypothetical protein DICPUDRAFT_154597 [Dictyostelium purpureum]